MMWNINHESVLPYCPCRMIHFLLLDIDAVKQIYLCCQKYWSIYVSSVYMYTHIYLYYFVKGVWGVFVHTEQFFSCNVLKVLQLLCFCTVFCLRKQSLIFKTHQQLYQAESLPGSWLPLCLCPGVDGSAEGGWAGQQAGVRLRPEAGLKCSPALREQVSRVKLGLVVSAI